MQPKFKVPVMFKSSFTAFLDSNEPNTCCPFNTKILAEGTKGCKLCNQLTGLSYNSLCPCHHFLDESIKNFNLPNRAIKSHIMKNFARQFVCSLKNIQVEWIEDD